MLFLLLSAGVRRRMRADGSFGTTVGAIAVVVAAAAAFLGGCRRALM